MKSVVFPFLILISITASAREFYQLRVYRFKGVEQQRRTEAYLQKALIPALHRLGIAKVGVFKPLETDSTYEKRLFVLIPYKSLDVFEKLPGKLSNDKTYLADGADYIDAKYDN